MVEKTTVLDPALMIYMELDTRSFPNLTKCTQVNKYIHRFQSSLRRANAEWIINFAMIVIIIVYVPKTVEGRFLVNLLKTVFGAVVVMLHGLISRVISHFCDIVF